MQTKASKKHARERVGRARLMARHNEEAGIMAREACEAHTGDTMHVAGKGRMDNMASYKSPCHHLQRRGLTYGQFKSEGQGEYRNGAMHVTHNGHDRANKDTFATIRQTGDAVVMRNRQ